MFRFRWDAPSVEQSFRDIAASQIDRALREAAAAEDFDAAIHSVRRRCKKLRGLLRLVRPGFSDYRKENKAIRNAAAGLSEARDSSVLVEALDRCAEEGGDSVPDATLRQGFVARVGAFGPERLAELLAAFRADMSAVRSRVPEWSLSGDGFGVLLRGMRDTYKAGRIGMRSAQRRGKSADFHDWRKAVKYHGYHLALLRDLAPELIEAERTLADRLGELLGDHHNLAVLRGALADTDAPDSAEASRDLRARAAARMKVIEEEAFTCGSQLLAERPAAIMARFSSYRPG